MGNHWYNSIGETCYGASLKDARLFNYYPSVTTVDKVIANPGLDKWKQNEVIKAASKIKQDPFEEQSDYYKFIKAEAFKESRQAAKLGNVIHKLAERYINGKALFFHGQRKDVWRIFDYLKDWIDENLAEPKSTITREEGAEVILVNKSRGYAGKADFVGKQTNGMNIILDFKTTNVKDSDVKKDGTLKKAKLYDSWCRQLVALDMCSETANILLSVVVSTNLDNLGVWVHKWDAESRKEAWTQFCGAVEIFRSIKKL